MSDKEKVAQWMMHRGYATGHGDTVEDLLKELELQLAENWTNSVMKVAANEREACAKVCEDDFGNGALNLADAIRARGEK